MRKRITWLVVSGLMILSLVLASCAPKVTEEKKAVTEEKKAATEEKKTVTEEKKTVTEEKKAATKEGVPQYGGVLNLVRPADPADIDIAGGAGSYTNHPTALITGELLQNNRLKGPAGTGEWTGMNTVFLTQDLLVGGVVERWELDYPNRITFHIRKGVHWQDKPPVNGRELTAEDVVVSIKRLWGTPGASYYKNGYPFFKDNVNLEKSIYIDPNNPWAVVIEPQPDRAHDIWETITVRLPVWPKELEKTVTAKWQDVVGVGPFISKDYVRGSILNYERNPNYWQKDPLHPENQLPYVDAVRVFIMPDWASRLAALRTGKIDKLDGVVREDAESFWKSNPDLPYKKYFRVLETLLHMRNDVKPFDDVRVRRAMMMAFNHEEILESFYKGDGEIFYYPVLPIAEFAYMWEPLEKMPQSVQELYKYNPDKAKKLLDEAGYPGPNRFTTSITLWSDDQVDMASLIAAYWAKVGVTLKIDLKENAVYTSMGRAKTHPNGYMASVHEAEPVRFIRSQKGHASNYAMIDKDYVLEAVKAIGVNYFDKEARGKIVKEVTVKMQEDALLQVVPQPYTYVFWQPWLKGYNGELYALYYVDLRFADYVWIDQSLK
ncbi:MAG: ABC transporter substrate-binding protein [Chloroflexi bacterium]|nr:ABC transporter substrate-binding protein [Chloroflexota bacterium]